MEQCSINGRTPTGKIVNGSTIIADQEGLYTLCYDTVIDNGTSCPKIDRVFVKKFTKKFADAGPDVVACSGRRHRIGVHNANNNLSFKWSLAEVLFAGKPDVAQPLLYYKNNSATVNAFKSYLTVTETSTGCIDKDTVKIFIHPTPVIFIDTIQPAYCVDDEISLHAFVYYHNLKSLEILSTYNGIKLALSNPVDTLMGLQNAGSSKYHFLMYTINLPKSDTGKHNLQISSTNNLECVYTKDYAINIVRPSKDSTNACSTITANNKGIISEQINVYPNPFSDNISIDITQLSLNKTMLVKITNSHGVTVVRKNINEAELPLDMTKILPGTYVLEIITNEKPYYQKIVKF